MSSICVAMALHALACAPQDPVTVADLVGQRVDLHRLAQSPSPAYQTVQFSSRDRRSVGPDAPNWFANADGFGGEPEPGFEGVVRAPEQPGGVGEYLLCDVRAPGAIVRTWSAGMDGTLRVWLDDGETPLFEGRATDFLVRKSEALLDGGPGGIRRLLRQEDADYLPVPFASRLRMTWEGSLEQLHFYHVQVRRYSAGTVVAPFDAAAAGAAVAALGERWWSASGLPENAKGRLESLEVLASGSAETVVEREQASAVVRFEAKVSGVGMAAFDLGAALRSLQLQVFFDDASVPQIEAPLGDFFATLVPEGQTAASLAGTPMTVHRDGRLECRFVMPFRERARFRLLNRADVPYRVRVKLHTVARPWTDSSLYFRADWRRDADLAAQAGRGPVDLPFLTASGRGRVVGAAVLLMNPVDRPGQFSNWWGEGDEKIRVNDEAVPSTFGTGTEDYFNYSWSHWRRFDYPDCGQPLASGPGNCGYVTNHRFHVTDDVTFEHRLEFAMELWTHRPVAPLDYARIVWWYGAPGARSERTAMQPSDCTRPELPVWGSAVPWIGAPGPVLGWRVNGGRLGLRAEPLVREGEVLEWRCGAGQTAQFALRFPRSGRYRVTAVDTSRRHFHPAFRQQGRDLQRRDDQLASFYEYELVVDGPGVVQQTWECVAPGRLRLARVAALRIGDVPMNVEGAIEAETAPFELSAGLVAEQQKLPPDRWSGGRHLWVRGRKPGDEVVLTFEVPENGRRARLRLTRSWDYGIVEIAVDDTVLGRVNTFAERLGMCEEFDLGVLAAGKRKLRVRAVERDRRSRAPHYYFGIDCVRLEEAR